jgi:hypothetical protein
MNKCTGLVSMSYKLILSYLMTLLEFPLNEMRNES